MPTDNRLAELEGRPSADEINTEDRRKAGELLMGRAKAIAGDDPEKLPAAWKQARREYPRLADVYDRNESSPPRMSRNQQIIGTRPYWQVAADQLTALARDGAGPNATAEQLRDAMRAARQWRPDLARAYDEQRTSLEGPDGFVRFTVHGVEVEIPTPRAAGYMIVERATS